MFRRDPSHVFTTYNLLGHLLPRVYSLTSGSKVTCQRLMEGLSANDSMVREKNEIRKGKLIAGFMGSLIMFPKDYENTVSLFQDIYKEIKRLIYPLTPPNREVEMAVVNLFRSEGIVPPKNAIRRKRPRFDKKTLQKQKPKHHEMSRYFRK